MHSCLIVLLLLVLTVPLGCAPAPRRQRASAPDRLSDQDQLAEIRSTAIPENYRAQIESRVSARLKMPAYRVTYEQQPYGSLVCGRLTERTAARDAAGAQPFFAYFDRQGHLAALHLYEASAPAEMTSSVAEALRRDCGFR